MPDNNPSRQNLTNSSHHPVDPAFRTASPPGNLPISPQEAATNPVLNAIANPAANPAGQPQNPNEASVPPIPDAPATETPPTVTNQTSAPANPPNLTPEAPAANSGITPATNNAATPPALPGDPATNPNPNDFPDFEEPATGDSEMKRIIKIGLIVLGILFFSGGVLFLINKSKQTETPNCEENPDDPACVDKPDDDDALKVDCEENPDDPACQTDDDDDDEPLSIDCEEQPSHPSCQTITEPNLPADTATLKNISLTEGQNPLSITTRYFTDAKQQNQVIELAFYDSSSNLVPLQQWAQNANLTIPGYVNDILTSEYHVFLVPDEDNQNPKLALVLESIYSNHSQTEEILTRWENYILADLQSFIYFGESSTPPNGEGSAAFNSSNFYPGGRYQNLLPDGSISLNYIVMRDKIIITNSARTFETAVDYVINRDDL